MRAGDHRGRPSVGVFFGDPDRLAAPAPSLTPELLDFVAHRYGLSVANPVDLGGSFNLNVLVGGCVVRLYGPWVGPGRIADLQAMRQTLRQRDIPIPDLVPTVNGDTWCRFGDCVLEVDRYVRGSSMTGRERLHAGMVELGRLHAMMADLELTHAPPIANHLPQERALDATVDAVASVRGRNPTPLDEKYCQAALDLAALMPVCPDLPTQVVHGDYWDNNVLFRGDRVVAVLDFDFAGVRPRIDDLAVPLGYLMEMNGLGQGDIRRLIEAYDHGAHRPLTRSERAHLPFAMARTALFFLQYLLLPGDDAYAAQVRREFRDQRGPSCEWWLSKLTDGSMSAATFT